MKTSGRSLNEKVSVGGIKFSNKLVQINVSDHGHSSNAALMFCKILADNKINMPFLSIVGCGQSTRLSCCVGEEYSMWLRERLGSEPDLRESVEFVPGVGLLSLYPHRSSLGILGLCLCAFGEAGLCIRGMASSLAALTFVINHCDLDRAITSLGEVLGLPENHAPFAPQIRVKFVTP